MLVPPAVFKPMHHPPAIYLSTVLQEVVLFWDKAPDHAVTYVCSFRGELVALD
jgi:hypothetical protein